MSDPRMTETVPVRITKRRYKELRRIAKANGHTLSWLLNYAVDMYFESLEQPGAAQSIQNKEQVTA